MAERAGVGATVASAVVFSILLASSFSVYYAAQENARLHSVANAEDLLADYALAFAGAGATNILLREQAFLSSTVLDCSSAASTVSDQVAGLRDVQSSSNLTVTVIAEPASDGPTADNLSMLAPFGGFVRGFVNAALRVEAMGAVSSMGVSFSRSETHYANLPARIGLMAGDCNSALADISEALSNVPSPNCTESVVSPVVAGAAKGQAQDAAAQGLHFAVESAIAGTAPCSVSVVVTVSQSEIQGPAGNFTARLQGGELVDVEV